MLSHWEALANTSRASVILMLKEDTRMALMRQMIPVSGVMRNWPTSAVPSEHVLLNGRVVISALGLPDMRRAALASRLTHCKVASPSLFLARWSLPLRAMAIMSRGARRLRTNRRDSLAGNGGRDRSARHGQGWMLRVSRSSSLR